MRAALRCALQAALLLLLWAGVGLGVNQLRPGGIPLVAPFPYEQDCPDKLEVPEGPVVGAAQALALVGADGVVFIDARPRDAFDAQHIPGARSLPFSFISPPDDAALAPLRGAKGVVVYCDSPGDKLAGLLADQLRQASIPAVKVLSGGWAAFLAAGGKPQGTP